MKRTKKGFTLVELLVVIAILAILASVSVVGYTAFIEKADKSVAEQELHQVVTLINAELMDDGKWIAGSYEVKVNADGTTIAWPTVVGSEDVAAVTVNDIIKAYADFAGLKGSFDLKEGSTTIITYTLGKVTVEAELTF